ncbi:DUF1697 domain-containing protein [Propionicimonas sp.]|uniref:DUF1697 domain-containing protein n=1 Tax=Propionicimonas sp. TaxID=1955623 RepID=UPI001800484E|nr:DUF1697 domain-containing protein [Propionicimonas sp.]MBU3977414.1 DUF1697 domain-containing protein [Actinomycetota bacterium]MBA3021338.1 DUF1697 domain-containing protein [Propionicimonas sp.]MBU3985924.1 DUF1697 domain-containing protein [Actinomycetota bacterium]MBU4008709.1 DUF1697 domain-containing protein [Actinomycetota bacterium]MBU4066141.1 DUF1697 domain-containing protein [Actinomycetota bacterium]
MTVAQARRQAPPARRVALLRGVNLGAAKPLAMPALLAVAESLGWTGLATHLRSGNLLFDASLSDDEAAIALREALRVQLGLDSAVVIRSGARLAKLVATHPFAGGDPARTVIACCDQVVSAEATQRLEQLVANGEQVQVDGADIFAAFPNGQASSKLALGLTSAVQPAQATARNLRTMTKLAELAAGPAT